MTSQCECGCGQTTTVIPAGWNKGTHRRFIKNHHFKGKKHSKETLEKMSLSMQGPKGPNWKGGRMALCTGYVDVWIGRDHPMAKHDGYCHEHRVVMAKAIGRNLTKEEVVHHINGVMDDNRIENLELFANNSDHMYFHKTGLRRAAA